MKKLKIFALLSIVLISCTDNSMKPENDDNESIKQINIEWPSLAETPWPIYHHDPQSTGRSQFPGPNLGMVESIKFEKCWMTMSGISIGFNNTAFYQQEMHLII